MLQARTNILTATTALTTSTLLLAAATSANAAVTASGNVLLDDIAVSGTLSPVPRDVWDLRLAPSFDPLTGQTLIGSGQLTIDGGSRFDVENTSLNESDTFGQILVSGFGSTFSTFSTSSAFNGFPVTTGGSSVVVQDGAQALLGSYSIGDSGTHQLLSSGFGSGISAGDMRIDSDLRIRLEEGGAMAATGLSLGFGALDLSMAGGASLRVLGDVDLGRLQSSVATIRINESATASADTWFIGDAVRLNLSGGELIGDVENNGVMNLNGRLFGSLRSNTGRIVIEDDALAAISQDGASGGILDNSGRFEVRGELDARAGLNSGTFTFFSNWGGDVLVEDGTLRVNHFDNSGTLDFVGGRNLLDASVENLDTGGFNGRDSRITVSRDATLIVTGEVRNNGEFRVDTGSAATFLDAVTGGVGFTGGGDVSFLESYTPGNSPAAITIEPDTTFASTSVLELELGGTTPGTQYDTLDFLNSLTLQGGELRIVLIDGFAPQAGDMFDLVTAQSIVGGFSVITLPTLSRGLELEVSVTGTAITAVVIPEPMAAALLAGLGGTTLLRRRRH